MGIFILPGRSMVEGARLSMLAALAPLHHRLAAAVPLPVPGRSSL
jgi:hypothetical protein